MRAPFLVVVTLASSLFAGSETTDPIPPKGHNHVALPVGPLEGNGDDSIPPSVAVLDDGTVVCSNGGEVDVARRDLRGNWSVVQQLEPIGGSAAPLGWGAAIAASGDHMFVSVVRHVQFPKPNEVHRFRRDADGVWQHVGLLLGPAELGFGKALASDGVRLIVGLPKPISVPGEARIYDLLPAGGFGPGITLAAPSTQQNQEFGDALAIAGDLAIVGAPFANRPGAVNAGRVYAWRLVGSTWTIENPPDANLPEQATGQDWFGWSLDFRDGLLAVGAPGDDITFGTDEGAVRLYRRLGPNSWSFVGRINGWAPHVRFGGDVALSATRLAAVGEGAVVGSTIYSGGCGLYRLNGAPVTSTTLLGYPGLPLSPSYLQFNSVAVSDALVAGAPGVKNIGGASVWDITLAGLDADGDGIPNGVEATTGAADCNQDLVPDASQGDCDSDGVPDVCLAGGRIDALGTGIAYGTGSSGAGKDVLIMTRHVVQAGDVGDVVGIITGINMALTFANTVKVGVWADPNGDGNPSDATLIRAAPITATGVNGGHNLFELPYTYVGPPGTSFFVGITYRDVDVDLLATHETPGLPGTEWLKDAPPGQLNLERPGAGGAFVSAVGLNARVIDPVMRQWKSLDLDGVPDACECVADLNGDGVQDGADLAIVLASWGTDSADIDLSGTTERDDLMILLLAWGTCP